MKAPHGEPLVCQVCGEIKPKSELILAAAVRNSVGAEIRKSVPEWSERGYICKRDLSRFRNQYIQSVLELDRGEITSLEKEVLDSLRHHETLASNINVEFDETMSFGEHLADNVALFGGSWKFILFFSGVLLLWIGINSAFLASKPFDPYPYILLNLVLSCLAAIQAPIIMMSQNRRESKDRLRAEHDYKVNLKSELEIRQLHEKVDHLLVRQWERLVEIQQIQIELMDEIVKTRECLDQE